MSDKVETMRQALAWLAKHDPETLDTYWHGTLTECRLAILHLAARLADLHDAMAHEVRDERMWRWDKEREDDWDWVWNTYDDAMSYGYWRAMKAVLTDHFRCHCGDPSSEADAP